MNTAQVIPFKKQPQPKQEAGNMYSDKFVQGYVMSSRLYRKEVWPFLSDAARNVYAELENRINGHNKESDFVSYSQLQGGDLPGSRKLGRTTVSNALQELIKLGVISVVSNGKQGMKSYRLNEVSLKDRFTNKTSPVIVPVQQQDQTSTASEPVTSPVTGHTIDTPIDSLENNNKAPEQFSPQNRPMLQFIEYRLDDQQAYTLRELTQKYPAQSDFTAQAKISFPKLTDEQINGELRNLAQWSMTAEKRISQKWMTTWLNWLKNFENAQNKTQQKSNQPKAQKQQPKKAHRFGQGVINP
ncbi:hypothetical protein [Acinetobacter sp. YH1901134]|uniref:hypothetical protein n=1 Tax=Acinetobacter sp. YH1901134 TaxID=2601199 RepID=UPI0015D1EB63|nr:hypothetical protein [Acinetobacter sp. YH1901134]